MTAAPEFHTSNMCKFFSLICTCKHILGSHQDSLIFILRTSTVRKTGSPRSITPPAAKSTSPYKAIVYINLAGGADSFNILTPGASGCSLYNEYWIARGRGAGIGLSEDKINNIDGSSAGIDGCGTLGVTSLLPAYRDIFNEGKGE